MSTFIKQSIIHSGQFHVGDIQTKQLKYGQEIKMQMLNIITNTCGNQSNTKQTEKK